MISTSEAISIIQRNVQVMTPVRLPLLEAVGLTLAADVYAPIDIPAFPQSSMDGYALTFNDWKLYKELLIEGEVAAGNNRPFENSSKKAVRIFTGAAVPTGADTVVMQEKARAENGKLIIEDEKLQLGSNVRPKGSEIKAGEIAMATGSQLSPASLGFLAGIGITDVLAYPNPTISIIVTGNELQQPGNPLEYGQVYESNSFALRAALQIGQVRSVQMHQVHDDLDTLTTVLERALNNCDVVLLTGGVSVGDYDFVLQAASRCGVDYLFHMIKQRPGKPLYFGKMKEKLVFGLPGNPSSVMTCFYMYVLPALELLSQRGFGIHTLQAPLGKAYQKGAGLTHFLKGYYDGHRASPLGAQESYRMRSFAQSNCLIQIDEEETECREGALVNVHLLPI